MARLQLLQLQGRPRPAVHLLASHLAQLCAHALLFLHSLLLVLLSEPSPVQWLLQPVQGQVLHPPTQGLLTQWALTGLLPGLPCRSAIPAGWMMPPLWVQSLHLPASHLNQQRPQGQCPHLPRQHLAGPGWVAKVRVRAAGLGGCWKPLRRWLRQYAPRCRARCLKYLHCPPVLCGREAANPSALRTSRPYLALQPRPASCAAWGSAAAAAAAVAAVQLLLCGNHRQLQNPAPPAMVGQPVVFAPTQAPPSLVQPPPPVLPLLLPSQQLLRWRLHRQTQRRAHRHCHHRLEPAASAPSLGGLAFCWRRFC
mmetsp:Transcript_7101/g.20814  ORF Transcript_7101/g.20814 Transcript_7101/m.20814 type:complete len:310 (+) Transcript_7101:578-1507(+)